LKKKTCFWQTFTRRFQNSALLVEDIPLPYPVSAKAIQIIASDYKGKEAGGLRLDVISCKKRGTYLLDPFTSIFNYR
jgi:hypothetical protein